MFRPVVGGAGSRQLIDSLRQAIEPVVHRLEFAAVEGVVGERRRGDARLAGLLEDHGIEPVGERQARPARRLFGGFARFRPYLLHDSMGRQISLLAPTFEAEVKEPHGLSVEPARINNVWIPARSAVLSPTFCRSR